MRFSLKAKAARRRPGRLWWLVAILVVLVVAGLAVSRYVYNRDLKPVSSSQMTQIFVVEKGSSVKQIAAKLEEAKLIRSAWAFQLYVHGKDLTNKLQAGTYALSPGQSTQEIAAIISKGQVASRLVTILPGRRIDQVRADLINDGFAPAAVDAALDPVQYGGLPVLAFKPVDVNSLEGLLWPDSYQRQADTDPSEIIRQALVAMGDQLTAEVQAAFAARGLSTYQGITLASIVLQEVGRPDDQAQAAQVFFARLQSGRRLESDATARYGAVLDGQAPSVTHHSAYNSYEHDGLPPTPIGSINLSSLTAVAHPATTDWLYFVSGDNGTTYFSRTLEEHEALTQQHCHKLCGN